MYTATARRIGPSVELLLSETEKFYNTRSDGTTKYKNLAFRIHDAYNDFKSYEDYGENIMKIIILIIFYNNFNNLMIVK